MGDAHFELLLADLYDARERDGAEDGTTKHQAQQLGLRCWKDYQIRQAEREGTKMEARRGKIAIENGWLDSRQLARTAYQTPVCWNKPSD